MVTVPTGAPLAQNPGSTTKNGNEAGRQPRAFIHPGLVFCPVCLLGLPFEVLSAEGCQPGCLREAGVAQPGEAVCVADGCSVPRGRHAPGNPDAVRAGLGGDVSRSSFPSWERIRMSFFSSGHLHACPCLSSPGHSRALLCIPPRSAFATMTTTFARNLRSRGTFGHTGTPLPRTRLVLPGSLLSPLGPRPRPLFVASFSPPRLAPRRCRPCR